MGVYLDDLEFCNFSWSVLWMLTYFAILLGIDNGPCKHICNVVEGNVVCSCLSGYTIMADGISCEGKWLWFTTEMWLKHYYVDFTDCRPQGVFLRVLSFQYCALQVAVQRQNCCLWDLLAEGIAGLLYRWLLKHFYLVYLLPGWGQARFCVYFLWCPRLFFGPLSICSHCCFSQSLTVQLWTCSLSSWGGSWQDLGMSAALGNHLRATDLPSDLFFVGGGLLFYFCCLENVRFHWYKECATVGGYSSMRFTWRWSSGLYHDKQWISKLNLWSFTFYTF